MVSINIFFRSIRKFFLVLIKCKSSELYSITMSISLDVCTSLQCVFSQFFCCFRKSTNYSNETQFKWVFDCSTCKTIGIIYKIHRILDMLAIKYETTSKWITNEAKRNPRNRWNIFAYIFHHIYWKSIRMERQLSACLWITQKVFCFTWNTIKQR